MSISSSTGIWIGYRPLHCLDHPQKAIVREGVPNDFVSHVNGHNGKAMPVFTLHYCKTTDKCWAGYLVSSTGNIPSRQADSISHILTHSLPPLSNNNLSFSCPCGCRYITALQAERRSLPQEEEPRRADNCSNPMWMDICPYARFEIIESRKREMPSWVNEAYPWRCPFCILHFLLDLSRCWPF